MRHYILLANRAYVLLFHPLPEAVFVVTVLGSFLAGKKFDLPHLVLAIYVEQTFQTNHAFLYFKLTSDVWILEINER